MNSYEPHTGCLLYHASEAVDQGRKVGDGIVGKRLGETDGQDIYGCRDLDCSRRLGFAVLNGVFAGVSDAGGIAACEYFGNHERD